jgi:hypothetical protein
MDNMMRKQSIEMTDAERAERSGGASEAEGSREAQKYLRELRMQDAKRASEKRSMRKGKR